MIKKLIFGLWLVATLSFGATLEDGINAAQKGDYKRAFTIFEDFANQGNSTAQNNLGHMYLNGLGTKKDYKKAIGWYEKAANQGVVNAQYNLGHMYAKGEVRALYNLGIMYNNGYGIGLDKKIAKEYFGKSCDGDFQDACYEYKELNQQGY